MAAKLATDLGLTRGNVWGGGAMFEGGAMFGEGAGMRMAHLAECSLLAEQLEVWPSLVQRCLAGSLHRVHAHKGRHMLKQLKQDHAK